MRCRWPSAVTLSPGLLKLRDQARGFIPGTDVGLALGMVALLAVLVVPLPSVLLDMGLAVSLTLSVLVLMVAMFLQRPLDFTSFPTLLLTTLLRLSLNVATTRLILSHGNEGASAAGHVVQAFGGFLMGGDVVIGVILFAILLVVNFMVITKGSGRIAEVAARFSLDAMPGKQMAIDADLSSGLINEAKAKLRRRELEEESGFYGAMDGAAKFVRGDAIAGLLITIINIIGGLAIGLLRHGMAFSDAAATFTTLTVGDGLVSQIPALLVSTAAGIVVTKGGVEGPADAALMRQLGGGPKPLALAGGAAAVLALMPGLPAFPFLALAALACGGAWMRWKHPPATAAEDAPAVPTEAPITDALRIDSIRLELGFGLLILAGGDTPRLTEQIKALRRSIAMEMGFVLPPVRIQDNMALGADQYSVRIKEVEAAKGELRPAMLLAMDPAGGIPDLPGEQQRLVSDLVPSQLSIGSIQRVLQMLLAERVSLRDLPTILEGIGEATAGGLRATAAITAHVRTRLARQISDSHLGPAGYIPLVTLSPEWEAAFADALVGPPEDRQLAIAPSRLGDFMQRFRVVFEAAVGAGEAPVLLCSSGIRSHVRAIVERLRPATPVLSQAEIFPRARIRTVGTL